MLSAMGYTYEEITYLDLQYAPEDFSALYKVILVPGGYAQWYNYWISKAAKQRIRNFVDRRRGIPRNLRRRLLRRRRDCLGRHPL